MNKKNTYIDRRVTLFLRTAVLGIGLIVLLFLFGLILPGVYQNWNQEMPALKEWKYPVMVVSTLAAATFWVAAWQILALLGLIDKNKIFTNASVQAMKKVKYCGFFMSALYVGLLPLVYFVAEWEDAPGLILMYGTVFIGVPVVVGVLAAVAQQLFQNAIDLKHENDLTV
jgi:hypothetical protein